MVEKQCKCRKQSDKHKNNPNQNNWKQSGLEIILNSIGTCEPKQTAEKMAMKLELSTPGPFKVLGEQTMLRPITLSYA